MAFPFHRSRRANASAIGAKVTARYQDGLVVARQLSAGEGYLSQGAAELVLARPESPDQKLQSVEVRWPDGQVTTHDDIPSADNVWKIVRQ